MTQKHTFSWLARAAIKVAETSALADHLEGWGDDIGWTNPEYVRLYWKLAKIVAFDYDDEHTQEIELWRTVRDEKAMELAQSSFDHHLGSCVYAFLDCVAQLWGDEKTGGQALATFATAMIYLGNAEVWYDKTD